MNATPFSTRHITSVPELTPATGGRALVLGGGGAAGNAWLIGIIAGLSEGGLDVTDADLIIGTSAGSTAGAQISGATPAELLATVLATTPPRQTARVESDRAAVDHLERTNRIIAAAEDPADMRRRMGVAAIDLAAADGSGHARWRATVAARLPGQHWPERRLHIVAVDARTGDPVVFDRSSGIDLVDAVAASCAGGPAYAIGDDLYIDGGYRRSSENADLAAGYGRVLVLSPLGGRSRAPREWGMDLAAQVDELRASGSRVEAVLPDDSSREAFGQNLMDLSTRPGAARAGSEQGRAIAGQLTGFWRGRP